MSGDSVVSKSGKQECVKPPTYLVQNSYCKLDFYLFGRVTVSLPLGALVVCFVWSILFKFNEVNKTVCHVPNLVPSISAITGVTPERYVWRTCIALHCTPRFAIGFIYYNWYKSKLHNIAEENKKLFFRLISVNFWLYMIENSCLVGVTFISNKENYPVHEKIFVVFMITALFYEFVTLVLMKWSHPVLEGDAWRSYQYKLICFVLIICFTAGLIYFFLRHRLFCEPNAFTCFSICEYGIAITNIIYHFSAIIDFKDLNWVVGTIPSLQEGVAINKEEPKSS